MKQEAELRALADQFVKGMRERQRTYNMKDTRTQLEREEEIIRRRKAKRDKAEAQAREREEEEMRECTFKPVLRRRSTGAKRSPRASRVEDGVERVRPLVERQQQALATLRALAAEVEPLRQHLVAVHADMRDRIQREETMRVIESFNDAEGGGAGAASKELIQRVRQMVAVGHEPESAHRIIVDSLVGGSQERVQQRVKNTFTAVRVQAEGELYARRLAAVHELETTEAQALSLKGGTLIDDAKEMGFQFGAAERARQSLPPMPSPMSLDTMRFASPNGCSMDLSPIPDHLPTQSFGSSLSLAEGNTSLQARTETAVSRQSSGQPLSLSGSVLQLPGSARGMERSMPNSARSSAVSLPAAVAAVSPGPAQPVTGPGASLSSIGVGSLAGQDDSQISRRISSEARFDAAAAVEAARRAHFPAGALVTRGQSGSLSSASSVTQLASSQRIRLATARATSGSPTRNSQAASPRDDDFKSAFGQLFEASRQNFPGRGGTSGSESATPRPDAPLSDRGVSADIKHLDADHRAAPGGGAPGSAGNGHAGMVVSGSAQSPRTEQTPTASAGGGASGLASGVTSARSLTPRGATEAPRPISAAAATHIHAPPLGMMGTLGTAPMSPQRRLSAGSPMGTTMSMPAAVFSPRVGGGTFASYAPPNAATVAVAPTQVSAPLTAMAQPGSPSGPLLAYAGHGAMAQPLPPGAFRQLLPVHSASGAHLAPAGSPVMPPPTPPQAGAPRS
eukprot:TRINITY_DN23033_c0_g1_i5.p1 TRINITY_DN23033_c0_g1~~TRINITY_DN23033_c0_g1_i5.p1  ORF type:complete len:737 (-),score=143.39 TRINITY_DN23033_c0_g1_i5:134-2344(-)